MALPPIFDRLRLPVIGSPLFIVSGPELVIAQCKAGVVGSFPALEDEMCLWVPGDPSPNRLDALVWCGTYLMVDATGPITSGANPFYS